VLLSQTFGAPPYQQLVWIKLQPGHIKCNVDVAFFNNNETMAYYVCFGDSTCALLFGKFDYMHRSVSVLEVGSFGLLHSLKMTISNVFHNVTCETDNKTLMDALSAHNVPLNEFCDLVSECKSLLCSNSDYVVSFVMRQANKVAYSIVRAALSHYSLILFMTYRLLCIRWLLMICSNLSLIHKNNMCSSIDIFLLYIIVYIFYGSWW